MVEKIFSIIDDYLTRTLLYSIVLYCALHYCFRLLCSLLKDFRFCFWKKIYEHLQKIFNKKFQFSFPCV